MTILHCALQVQTHPALPPLLPFLPDPSVMAGAVMAAGAGREAQGGNRGTSMGQVGLGWGGGAGLSWRLLDSVYCSRCCTLLFLWPAVLIRPPASAA